MNRKIRFVALLVVIMMSVSAISGCSIIRPFVEGLMEGTQATSTPAATPQPTVAPTQAPVPTEEPVNEASLALTQLDLEIFSKYETSDALSYHLAISDPSSYALTEEPETGWGPFTYEESASATEEEKAWLERLSAIDREALNADEQLTYDTLEQYLTWSIESFDYYYFDEVLDTLVGLHSNLPLNMVFYTMKTVEDVEGYLTLIEDTPRLMQLVLAFEQEKSKAGYFMTDNALEQVLDQLQDVIDAKGTLFLYSTFDDSIAEIEMSDEQRTEFQTRNDAYVDALIDSYQALYDGLKELSGTCTNEAGLEAYGETGKKYFELSLAQSACSTVTPDEAAQMLRDEIEYQVSVIQDCYSKDSTVYDNYDQIDLSVGTTEENLAFLEKLMAKYYPELPEHTITFMDCPQELEDQFSPAAYLIPPIDDPTENLIILNTKTLEDDTRYLDTLAHEGYPGHMYHYQYIRTLIEKTGLTRQALDLTGYYEAWSQSGELFFDSYNLEFSNVYCKFMNANSNLGNLLLPALFSIEVNYNGATEQDIYNECIEYYGEDGAKELAPVYYQYAVENPFYFLKYAMGYTIYQQEYRKAKDALGYKLDLTEYHKAFLDLGPTYFNFILPVLDDYIASHKS